MNVIKPRGLGIIHKIYSEPPKTFLSIAVLGFVDFRQPQAFLPDTEMWPFTKEVLPENTLLDLGMPKVFAEVLVFGKATPKSRVPVPAMAVEFAIGSIHKRAIVFGDRYWRLGGAQLRPTSPKPFLEMPVDYAHAFGGPDYEKNPLGKGFAAERRTRAGELVALPNVEMPERPIVSPADRPEPYGFGPIDIAWPQRSGKAGTFNQNWVRSRFPAAPEDQDPTIHNAAPPDQWSKTWFTGDEPFAFSGMHPDYDSYRGRLPGMRARAFIGQTQPGGAPALLEVMLHAETVFLFPSDLKAIVLYRGRAPAADSSGRDITDVMIAYERLADEPRPQSHYAEVFALRTDPETKGLHAMNDLQLSPVLPPETQAERDAERDAYAAALLEKQQRRADRLYDAALAKMGLAVKPDMPRPKVQPSPFPVFSPAEIARGEADVAGLVAVARRLMSEAEAQADAGVAKARTAIGELQEQAAARLAATPAAVQNPAAERALADLARRQADLATRGGPEAERAAAAIDETVISAKTKLTAEALARQATAKIEPVPLAAVNDDVRGKLGGLADQLRGRLAGASIREQEALQDALRAIEQAMLPTGLRGAPAAPAFDAAAGSAALSGHATQMIAALEASVGRLPADLQPEVAAKAAEAKAALQSAAARATGSLPFEILPKDPAKEAAPLDDAALNAAMPKMAAARDAGSRALRLESPEPLAPTAPLSSEQQLQMRAAAEAAIARGASLAGHDFAGADLRGLSFEGLDLTGAMFEQGNLTGADFSHARLARAVFTAASLDKARFDHADLRESNLCRVKASGASLTQANLARARFLYANCERADFTGSRFDHNIFLEVHFAGAVLRESRWEFCSITQAAFPEADFSAAEMRLCSFMKTDLSQCVAKGATLFRVGITDCPADGADFSDSKLTRMAAAGGSSFRNGVFRRAQASRSTWFKVDLSGADFARADLDQAFMGECKAVQASFYRAVMRRAVLIGTDFTDSDFAEANLFMAMLRNATLDRAELRHASLYGAFTEGVSWRLCDLTKANLRLTEFTRG
jgi:uncharacterized protein YjbI with pentapeptide repeats